MGRTIARLLCIALLAATSGTRARGADYGDPKSVGSYSYRDMTASGYDSLWAQMRDDGYRPVDFEAYTWRGQTKYAAVWIENVEDRGWASWRGLTSDEFAELWEEYLYEGYRLIDQEAYVEGGRRLYAGIWVENVEDWDWASYRNMTSGSFTSRFNELRDQGYRPVDFEAYLLNGELRYSGIWVRDGSGLGWALWRNLTSEQYTAKFNELERKGYRVVDVESYQSGGRQLYAGIWVQNRNRRAWMQYRNMTVDNFIQRFRELDAKGYRVTNVRAYPTSSGLRYAAIWRQNTPSSITPEMFRIIDGFKGEIAFHGVNLRTGERIGFKDGERRYLASVTKVAIMAEAYRQAEEGKLNLRAKQKFTTSYYREEGKKLKFADLNKSFTFDKYVEYMIDYSDTTSTDILVNKLGEANINKMLSSLGLRGWGRVTSIASLDKDIWGRIDSRFPKTANHVFEDWLRNTKAKRKYKLSFTPRYTAADQKRAYDAYYATGKNSATARDLVGLVERMARRQLWSVSASNAMLAKMRRNGGPLFAANVPGARVGSKGGDKFQVKTEVGFFDDSKGNPEVVLAILTRKVPDPTSKATQDAFKKLGALLYRELR